MHRIREVRALLHIEYVLSCSHGKPASLLRRLVDQYEPTFAVHQYPCNPRWQLNSRRPKIVDGTISHKTDYDATCPLVHGSHVGACSEKSLLPANAKQHLIPARLSRIRTNDNRGLGAFSSDRCTFPAAIRVSDAGSATVRSMTFPESLRETAIAKVQIVIRGNFTPHNAKEPQNNLRK